MIRNYSAVDLLRFRRLVLENPVMKPLDILKKYNEEYPELTEEQKLYNLKKFFEKKLK